MKETSLCFACRRSDCPHPKMSSPNKSSPKNPKTAAHTKPGVSIHMLKPPSYLLVSARVWFAYASAFYRSSLVMICRFGLYFHEWREDRRSKVQIHRSGLRAPPSACDKLVRCEPPRYWKWQLYSSVAQNKKLAQKDTDRSVRARAKHSVQHFPVMPTLVCRRFVLLFWSAALADKATAWWPDYSCWSGRRAA